MRKIKKTLNNKSFFKKFLVSYIIALSIPFFTIMFTYYVADKAIRKEIITSSESSLQQFFNVLDTNISEMIDIGAQVLNSENVKSYAYASNYQSKEDDPYQIFQIKKFLNNIPRSNLYDFFVYYNYYDTVISAINSSLSGRYYYDSYYKNGITFEDFQKSLFLDKYNKATLLSFGSQNNMPLLAVALKQNASFTKNNNLDATVVLVLNSQNLKEILDSAVFQREGDILIVNKENQILVSSDNSNLSYQTEYLKDTKKYYSSFDQEKYVIKTYESEVIDCSYVSVIPTKYFWERLTILRWVCGIGLFFCAIISGFIVVYFSKRNYLPIDSVLHIIQHRTSLEYDKRLDNEFKFISEIIEKSFEKNKLLSERIKMDSSNIHEDFWINTLQGTYEEDSYEEDMFKKHGVRLLSDGFAVALFQVEDVNPILIEDLSSTEDKRLLTFLLKNVLQEVCAVDHQGYCVNIAPQIYALVINYGDNDVGTRNDISKAICQKSNQFFISHLGIECTIAISDVHIGLQGIHTAFMEANHGLKYRFSHGKGSLIAYNDISHRSFQYSPITDAKSAQILISYVKERDTSQDQGMVIQNLLENQCISNDVALETLECFKFDMVNTVNKIIFDIGANQLIEEGMIKQLLGADTFSEFLDIMGATLLKLRNYDEKRRTQNNVCKKADNYIKEHYGNPELNVNMLGNELKLTPSYLSKLFKEQNGIGLLDYLYKVRVEHSRQLLKENSMTIGEVATQTGFISSSAFIKMFKKSEGITPGAYRDLVKK